MKHHSLPVVSFLLLSTSASAQCSVQFPKDTVTLYWGYEPMQCATLQPAVASDAPYEMIWSNGATTNSIEVCFDAPGRYIVRMNGVTGCMSTDSVFVNIVDVHCGNNDEKVAVCHTTPGNPANAHTICINADGVPAHLAHGCSLGSCGFGDYSGDADLRVSVTPNPFTRDATVIVSSASAQVVRVTVVDAMGRTQRSLMEAPMAAGSSSRLGLTIDELAGNANFVWIRAQGDGTRATEQLMMLR